eukprot:3359939-Pyramimonas_sp.AAC.1
MCNKPRIWLRTLQPYLEWGHTPEQDAQLKAALLELFPPMVTNRNPMADGSSIAGMLGPTGKKWIESSQGANGGQVRELKGLWKTGVGYRGLQGPGKGDKGGGRGRYRAPMGRH